MVLASTLVCCRMLSRPTTLESVLNFTYLELGTLLIFFVLLFFPKKSKCAGEICAAPLTAVLCFYSTLYLLAFTLSSPFITAVLARVTQF